MNCLGCLYKHVSTGVKSYYSSYATGGMPGARLGVIAAFAEGNGFASLSQYIANKRPDEYWFGFTNYEYAILSVVSTKNLVCI